MLGRGHTGDISRLARTVLPPPSPGTIAHGQTVDRNGLAVQNDLATHAPDLVEMVRAPKGRTRAGQRRGRHDALKTERGTQTRLIVILQRIGHAGFDYPNRNAGRERHVIQILTRAAAQGRYSLRNRALPTADGPNRPTPRLRPRPCRYSAVPGVYNQPPRRRSGWENENQAVSVDHQSPASSSK